MRPESIVSNLVYASCGMDVKTVLCDGEVVVENRRMVTVDEEEVLRGGEAAARELLG
jgi:5-methylthioadenosine/S-adenosylhomocysteine deaminase